MGRRFLIVSVVVAAALSGCSDSAKMDGWTAVSRLAEPLTFDNALADDQVYGDKYWTTMQDDLGIVLSGETRTDKYGSWHPLTLAPDAPLLDIDPAALDADLDPMWTPEALRSAWQTMAEFLVDERLDSELVWDDTPENRQLVADRADSGAYAWDWYPEPYHFIGYLNGDGFTGTAEFGSLAVDQNGAGWRQAGVESAFLAAPLRPAQPAEYTPGLPRTLVSRLRVDSVARTESPGLVDITASVYYCRPIHVENTEVVHYECTDMAVVDRVAATGRITDLMQVSLSREQMAGVSNETRRRLPLLEATSAGGGWQPWEVGGLALLLPSSATEDADGSCAYQPWEERPGQVFRLGSDFGDRAGCLLVVSWTPAPDDDPQVERVLTNETIWGAQAPGLLGTVDIRTYATYDTVDFFLTEGPGPDYEIKADVPSGTGEQFARQLLATLDASVVPSPSSSP